ncbi:MAG TPA: transcriptional repressor [Nocardioidaceae bacterium]|nr:transcriptional repressor [Nocardioidaceae bacterium]
MGLPEQLRASGHRLTAQRQQVLDAVADLGHATPEQVRGWVGRHARPVNISTVYRTLELLEQLGLVTHAHLTHGAPTYHAASAVEHGHLVCRECGSITEVTPDEVSPLADRLRLGKGFVVDVGHLTVFGRCARCAG